MSYRTLNELYLMECEGYVKIGIAFCSESRRRLFQTGNPFPIKILKVLPCDDPQAEETQFHRKYREYRVRGEWFKFPKEVLYQLLFETDWHVRNDPPVPYEITNPHTIKDPTDPEYWSTM